MNGFRIFVSALLLLPALAGAQGIPGDANGDGRHGSADLTAIVAHVLETAPAASNADCTNDGRVDALDIACVVHLIETTVPSISDFNPKSGRPGTLVTLTGQHLATPGGAPAVVTLQRRGGGTLDAPVTAVAANSLTFTLPVGAASGVVTVQVPERPSATSANTLTVLPSSDFSLSAAPASAVLIAGEATSYTVTLASTSDFSRLADLAVTGLPAGVTASFVPPRVTAGQSAVLNLDAAVGTPLGTIALTLTASAEVDGTLLEASTVVNLDVQAVTTTFRGRTVVADALQTPLAGVTVTMLGVDDAGNATGCSAQTTSDAAGNFVLANLPAECAGGQLVRYDGSTATAPPGNFAGVDLHYVLTLGAVTTSPVLVHLPRIDNAETVWVEQNAAADQDFVFTTIPDLEVTVYAGTTLTLADGGTPDPFPLTAVAVPVDRLPDEMPASSTSIDPFVVAFQPANAHASQPVAVTFPNVTGVPPLTAATLQTLDPTRGAMVVYGTGTISADGRQIVPDFDPSFPGRRYGIVNFDWHGPRIPPPLRFLLGAFDCDGSRSAGAGTAVQPSSGVAIRRSTDLSMTGLRHRTDLRRTQRSLSTDAGPFGIGTGHDYSYRLDTANPSATRINLILPDGKRIPFVRSPSGELRNANTPALADARMITPPGQPTDLRFGDGTILRFDPGTAFLESVTNPDGERTDLARDPTRPVRIDEIVDPGGRRIRLTYDAGDRITRAVSPDGGIVDYTYNAQGYLETVTDAEGGVTLYEYDAQNRLIRVTDARGIVVADVTYDGAGRVIQEIQADGGVWTYSYTLANPQVINSPVLETRVTDPLGRVTTYRYNPQGYLISATDALGQTSVFERELGTNRLLRITGNAVCDLCGIPEEGDVSFSYDLSGNVTGLTDALGRTTSFTYDPLTEQVASITDALGHVQSFTYNATGRPLTVTDQNGRHTDFTYDAANRLTSLVDPLGNSQSFTYDAFDNLIQSTNSLGETTSWVYDALSQPLEMVDPLGRRTLYQYDGLGRVISITDPENRLTSMTYDAVGNLLSVTDPRGNTTSFTYDSMNRLVTQTDPRSNTSTRFYDLAGNLVQFVDRRGQISNFFYDDLDRLVMESYGDGSTVVRTYDARGRVIHVDDSAGGVAAFTYDAAGDLLSIFGAHGTVFFTRDDLGRVSRRQVQGQPAVDYVYDPVGNVTSISTIDASINLTYDDRDLVTRIDRSNGVSTEVTYDALGRILTMTHANGGGVLGTQSYTYGRGGQRLSSTSDFLQPLATPPSASVVEALSNRLLERGSVSYTYDADGNRLTATDAEGTTTYSWGARNRLRSVTLPDGSVHEFTYDFANNLVTHVLDDGVDRHVRGFIVDEATNVIHEAASDGQVSTLLTGAGIDEHFAVRTDSGTSFALTDALNSTVGVVDETGVLQGTMSYEPFGAAVGTASYPFTFTGRMPITDDLYFYRARFYDPRAGRFLSQDPIGIRGGDVNLYRYVNNDPISLIDPEGEIAFVAVVPFLVSGTFSFVTAIIDGKDAQGIFIDTAFGTATAGFGKHLSALSNVAKSVYDQLRENGCVNPFKLAVAAASSYVGSTVSKYFDNGLNSIGEELTESVAGNVSGEVSSRLTNGVYDAARR